MGFYEDWNESMDSFLEDVSKSAVLQVILLIGFMLFIGVCAVSVLNGLKMLFGW